LRHSRYTSSNNEIRFLLKIRKLILFTVHELNKPLKDLNCVKWWANPLDLISYKTISQSKTHTLHQIQFIIQPGNIIHLKVEVRQKNSPISINDKELEMVGHFEFVNAPTNIFGFCDKETKLNTSLKSICVCKIRPEMIELEKATESAMKVWSLMDPELKTWKPYHSFMIEDYMDFEDYKWFVKSPGNTTKEIGDINYSKEYCSPELQMLVMISSAPNHFKSRRVIRETFANPENLKGKGIKVVFLM